MYCKLAFATLALFIGSDFVSAQEKIPASTTAAELWNPWTWFWPYAIASAESYRDYYEKAQKATNELYQQIYKTNAFPWITGNWGSPQQNQNQDGGKDSQNKPAQDNNQNGGNDQNKPAQDNQNGGNDQNKPSQDNNQNGGDDQNKPSQDNNQNGGDDQNKPAEDNNQNSGDDQNKPTQDDSQDDGKEEESKDDDKGPSAQVQGGAQGESADAGVNGKV